MKERGNKLVKRERDKDIKNRKNVLKTDKITETKRETKKNQSKW